VRRGLTNREIADELGITEDGVKAHLSRLFLRFGASNRVELLSAVDLDSASDRTLAATTDLGHLRAIAGRANVRSRGMAGSSSGNGSRNGSGVDAQIVAVRDALAAVDGALAILGELPPETTGPVLSAVRKRLATAFEQLDRFDVGVAPETA
jgi:hypothetical protein